MFEIAVGELSLKPYEFWNMTYAEFLAMYRGQIKRQKQTINEIKMAAWFTEYYRRHDKLPPINSILDNKRERQTSEQMLEMAKSITAMMGGEVGV